MEKIERRYLHLSVHQLVDAILRSGDIDERIYNTETMKQGSLIHSNYQKSRNSSYLSEYPLSGTYSVEEGTVYLQGRADGIDCSNNKYVIEEIKSTVEDLEEFFSTQEQWHLGQLLCYARMFMEEKGLDNIEIKLVYISQKETNKQMSKLYSFSYEEVKSKVDDIIRTYFKFSEPYFYHLKKRDESAFKVKFPYLDFRPGQREMAKYCYSVAKNGGVLFAEAPTGIGKTISSIFPFVKNYKEGKKDRIFYLTAKNSGFNSALQAVGQLRDNELDIKDIYLHSKDKMCAFPGKACNPIDCPFAKNYYVKIKNALLDAYKLNCSFDQPFLIQTARKYEICPFEFQLDLSLWCDLIVMDYNYFFDPYVYLQRYFDEGIDQTKYMVLVDEGHNLIDRSRSMFSASLSIFELKKAKASLTSKSFASSKRALSKVEKALKPLLSPKKSHEFIDYEEIDLDLLNSIESLKRARKKESKVNSIQYPNAYKDFYQEANRLYSLKEDYFLKNKCAYRLFSNSDSYSLFCIDPSSFLSDRLSKISSLVIFSATLSPINYFMDASLGTNKPYLLLPSPFPKENFKLIIAPKISLRYQDRENSKKDVIGYLEKFVESKKGNYFIYFPSYAYLEDISTELHFKNANMFIQYKTMTSEEKLSFLDNFPSNPKETNVGLLVLGGAFSEGIDLPDDRLIGVAVVGIGLSSVCHENELIRNYYDSKEKGHGFDYAYKNPGINRVMQAVGRLIRSPTDRGAALLIDDRYLYEDYRKIFSRVYEDYEVVTSSKEIKEVLSSFYRKRN